MMTKVSFEFQHSQLCPGGVRRTAHAFRFSAA